MTEAESALLALMDEDRAENRAVVAGTDAYAALRRHDAERRRRAEALLSTGEVSRAEALYAAAWLFNHGETPAEARRGRELALLAADLGYRPARWLAAAALDRSLMYADQPQKYGTNRVPDGRRIRVWDVEPATTDAERAEWDVPPIAELQARAERASREEPQPDLSDAPAWLLAALERWEKEDGA